MIHNDFKEEDIIIDTTTSLCPDCLNVIPSKIINRNNKVYLQKYCQNHGRFEVLIYSDADAYLTAFQYNTKGQSPRKYMGQIKNGCPYDCGLCEAHQQHTCVGIIEITTTCNLSCNICFADAQEDFFIPLNRVKEMIDLFISCEHNPEVLQISGGEPTLHPDFFDIIQYVGQQNIRFPMINTNGIKLANRLFAKRLANCIDNDNLPIGKPLIYLQFDGLSDGIYMKLRGKTLLDLKLKALQNCRELGMNVALVTTIVHGINDHEIGKLINFALQDSNIKMINFQPSAMIGRCSVVKKQMTIPDVINAIEQQTQGLLKYSSFFNLPCPHPTCSMCSYVYSGVEKPIVLNELVDVSKYMDFIADKAIPYVELTADVKKAIESFVSSFSNHNDDNSQSCCSLGGCYSLSPSITQFLDNITSISIHSFMDKNTFDLNRAQKCCITEILPNGQMIPFCVYNIIYRGKLQPKLKQICVDKMR